LKKEFDQVIQTVAEPEGVKKGNSTTEKIDWGKHEKMGPVQSRERASVASPGEKGMWDNRYGV